MKKIAFTGGGTGGHAYPIIAVAEELKKKHPQAEFIWIGQKNGIEEELARKAGIPFFGISAGKLRRYFSLKNFTDIFNVIRGYFQAKKILKREKPALLFSKGGFVSVPPVIAAAHRGIPVFIHESDSDMGLANRISARYAKHIFVPYAETRNLLKKNWHAKTLISGNPVREAVRSGNRAKGRSLYGLNDEQPFVLVLGGSSGALQVNELIEAIAPELHKEAFIVHQTGRELFKESTLPNYVTLPYIEEDLPHLIAAADIVISRAGAGAIWEFAALGSACIFIPLSIMRGDQLRNARLLEKRGAAVVLCGEQAESRYLLNKIRELLSNREKLETMKKSIISLADVDSKAFLADKIIEEVNA
jgi:UDP-N-acetylglucosamine--N-acetylmuramyl-(pentapeptide) pyrophosphoryl-undecaprenol N-acetylglucosamine transferase